MDGIELVKEQCKVFKLEYIFEKSRDQVDKKIDQLYLSKCILVRVLKIHIMSRKL